MLLVERGADIDKPKLNGCTPLYMASLHGHDVCVRLLLGRKADVDGGRQPRQRRPVDGEVRAHGRPAVRAPRARELARVAGAARAERDRERRGAPRALLDRRGVRRRRGLEPGEAPRPPRGEEPEPRREELAEPEPRRRQREARAHGRRRRRRARLHRVAPARARRRGGGPARADVARRRRERRARRRRARRRRRRRGKRSCGPDAAEGAGGEHFLSRGLVAFFLLRLLASRELAALAVLREATQYSDLLLSYKLAGLALCG